MTGAPTRRAGPRQVHGAVSALSAGLLVLAGLAALASRFGGERDEPAAAPAEEPVFDRGDNGLWARRRWLHEARTDAELEALVATLRARGIKAFYPFLGPPDAEGRPGWREGELHHPVDPAVASDLLTRMKAFAPEIAVLPWTGGVRERDVVFADAERNAAWRAAVLALPVDGVQLNVETLPEQEAFLALLRDWKGALGDRTLSVAAYPPPTPLHPYPEVHWSPAFLREVCLIADDLAVMAYDTALAEPGAFTALVAEWTDTLLALPPPEEGGCTMRIGVPAYEDDEPWHRPEAETLEAGLLGVRRALEARAGGPPAHLLGVAIYASWTTDEAEWATYDRLWRGRAPVAAGLVDRP